VDQFSPAHPGLISVAVKRYDDLREADLKRVRQQVRLAVVGGREAPFAELWPGLLCEAHVTHADLKAVLLDMERDGEVRVLGRTPQERTIKDHHRLAIGTADQRETD
jgi:hypothetical protein